MSWYISSLVRDSNSGGGGGHVAMSCLTQQLETHLSLKGDLRRGILCVPDTCIILTGHREKKKQFVCCLFFPPKARSFLLNDQKIKTFILVFFVFFLVDSYSLLFCPPSRSHFQVILQGHNPFLPAHSRKKMCITPTSSNLNNSTSTTTTHFDLQLLWREILSHVPGPSHLFVPTNYV